MMAPPKEKKQRTITELFTIKSNESPSPSIDVVDESMQNVLIEMRVNQVKNETGWTLLFDFDIHYIASDLQQFNFERDAEIESASSSRASNASTTRAGTPMETEDDGATIDDESVDGIINESSTVPSSEGKCIYKQKAKTLISVVVSPSVCGSTYFQ